LDEKCIVTIEADYDRYVNDDNSFSKTMTKEIDVRYIQLVEDMLHRLVTMGEVSKT